MRCFKQALNDKKVSKRQNVFILLPCQFHMLSCAFSLSYPIDKIPCRHMSGQSSDKRVMFCV
jgi:hypothetical protein